MKKILLGVSAAMMMAGSLMAQDVHFTQYFTSPLTLNPALTGLTQCDLRFAANYRTQWANVSGNPYVTGTVSYDMSTLKGKLPEGDALGIGVLGLYDVSGLGGLTNTTVGLSLAYHKAFGQDKQHTISLGAQGFLVQKSLDFNKLKFGDQFVAATGLATLPTNETFSNADISYPDFNAGVMYSGHVSEHATAYAGFSYYHLTEPVETFLGGNHAIHSRQTAFVGGSFELNEDIVLYASGLYQTQASATEVLAGAAVGFVLNPGHDPEFQKNTILYLGGWYRYQDAISPYVGFQYAKMQIGVSYDVNVSSFTPATNGQGAFEVSLIYNGCINHHEKSPTYNFACPKF
ncbi:MAG TPA: PorP/SprF family type IX secretion system membrane protein [Flavipsychrobacter sp.]|nr:PorP/SprF family type IX secretion system membrane protein [Flavipsychrobacter sp.]